MSKQTKIYIKDCTECKDCQSDRTRGTDSFDVAFDFHCRRADKPIVGYVCWNEKMPSVPEWCPRRKKI